MNAVLIANRGEIAVRIIRAAQELGMRTIAVYSELDRDAPHVALADEGWNIGPAPAAESYLNIERILEVAAAAHADMVHPGYGFLAENAKFASAVLDAGLTWVGPPPEAIAIMGDKISSRKAAEKVDVRGVPGTLDPLDSVEAVSAAADEFGFPIAIKAAHGGGGKGLKVVWEREDLGRAFESAAREADQYFANPEVYVERYLPAPRHIEAQVVFDHHGTGVFLGERDCSVQRRHQKLIEEAPAIGFTEEQRAELARASLAVAEAAGYQNAGTVEFLLERDTGDLYFLEMNTRLQVEHTVTEMVTGYDLVREQFRIAAGEPVSIPHLPPISGHAIQLRINAEDPGRNFLPNPGTIVDYREPGGFGVRVDSGVEAGWQVSQYYDNLMAKLVVWGRDRTEAIGRAQRALAEFQITGVATTIPAHQLVLAHPDFVAGNHHTKFIEEEVDLSGITRPTAPTLPEDEALLERNVTVEVGGRRYDVRMWTPEVAPVTGGQPAPRRRPPKLDRKAAESEDAGVVVAPMQGTIVKLHHKAGESVQEGQPLVVLEAMKMENEIAAPIGGEIVDLRVQTGDTVAKGQVLAIVR
jgi:acetyl-CoA/propionyl-CoA carboxylase biotin carboxyl carrier protein